MLLGIAPDTLFYYFLVPEEAANRNSNPALPWAALFRFAKQLLICRAEAGFFEIEIKKIAIFALNWPSSAPIRSRFLRKRKGPSTVTVQTQPTFRTLRAAPMITIQPE